MDTLEQAAQRLRSARRLLVFTGAGISAESGIPTFRDAGGLWQRYPPEQFATWRGVFDVAVKRPKQMAEFLHALLSPIANAAPNPAHRAIAAAQAHARVTVVTQNVDQLHQEAGSTCVHEVHGSFFEIDVRIGRPRSRLTRGDLLKITLALERVQRGPVVLPRLLLAIRQLAGIGRRGAYYPRIVLFGDGMAEPAWTQAMAAAADCDAVLQVGCSGDVMPAALVPIEAKSHGASIIAVDPNPTNADVWLRGRAADVVPRLFEMAYGQPPN